jgi:hypothetical protein
VIIITGPGRSGTSVLARLYQELGFDPGGNWNPDVRAGLEHGKFWRLNNEIATAAGITMLHPAKPAAPEPKVAPPPPPTGYRRIVRGGRRRLAKALSPAPLQSGTPRPARPSRVLLADWDRVPAVIDKYHDRMVRLSKETVVVKDPRFMFTLPLWLAAGAQIEHVTITVRPMADMVASRKAAGHSEFNPVELRNSLTYGLGVITAAVLEYNVSHSYIAFPGFLHDLDALHASLRFPEPVSLERFRETAERVFDPGQVTDWSADAGSI